MSFKTRTVSCPEAGERCTVSVHSSGLKVYICEKKNMGSNYAVFGTHYGSTDTEFALGDSEMRRVPEGIAHFLEHKLFEGEDGDAFEKFAVTGASANAYTSFDRTCYLFSCSGKFYENLDILLNFVTSPYFTPETVAKEQGIIGQEIRMYEDSPGWRVLFNLFRIMYRNHPVKIEIAGTVESIAEITDKTLYDCYRTFYSPSNMFVCLCGNFDAARALEMIDSRIKPTRTPEIRRSEFDEPDSIVSGYTELAMPVSMPLFAAGIKDTAMKTGKTAKQIAVSELLLELCAGKISPLYNHLLKEGLISRNFSTEFFFGHGYGALLFEGESNDPEKVGKAIVSEIAEISSNGVDEGLFEDAKRKLYGMEIRRFNDAEETVNGFIDCAINGVEPYEMLQTIKNLTADDVVARARELDPDKFALSVITAAEK